MIRVDFHTRLNYYYYSMPPVGYPTMERGRQILGFSSATKHLRAPVRGWGVRGRGLRGLS